MNGDTVSQTALNGDLKVIAQDNAFQCYLATTIELSGGDAQAVFPVVGAGATAAEPTTYNSAFAESGSTRWRRTSSCPSSWTGCT